ncbi:MAG TPA: GNAT family N-acetyltransferase [Thermoplasmata archaeon]|nr:GNAT family N-acetyltransferase [Thermoplasmata archaeon]
MTLRRFRRADGPIFEAMLRRNFPDEQRILEKNSEGVGRVVARVFRWDARFVLALAAAVGRPVFSFFVIEEAGRPVATALVSYGSVSGYVSAVMVDEPYRGRGYARRLMEQAVAATRRAHRAHVVLDVLEENLPARSLYASLGFTPIRAQSVYVRELTEAPPSPLPAPPSGVRPLRRSDGRPLFLLAQSTLPPAVAEAMPAHPRQFFLPPWVGRLFAEETEAWVAGPPGAPQGFLRATHDPTSRAGHLSAPLFGPKLEDAFLDRWMAFVVDWFAVRAVPRIVTEVPDHAPRAAETLRRAGFLPALQLRTLRREIAVS